MTPEAKAREEIDKKLVQSGWVIQDVKEVNLMASLGVAVREFPTDSGPVDYALFVDGIPVGVVEAKREEAGEILTSVESQSARYANSSFKWIKNEYKIRFAYEATNKLTRFTDYCDEKYRSRRVFSFHRPETLLLLLKQPDYGVVSAFEIRQDEPHLVFGRYERPWRASGTRIFGIPSVR